MTGRRIRRVALLHVVALLAACAATVMTPPERARRAPDAFPDGYYRQLLAQGKPVFRVDAGRSEVVIEVRRGGSLARLGHDHVVASHHVSGLIAPDEGRADVYLPLDALVVDEPALRAQAGFDSQPSADDIAGTRRNMLTRVLETDRNPYVLVAVSQAIAPGTAGPVRATITLHGTTRTVDATVQFDRSPDDVTIVGTLAIEQSQFGITPLSIMGGAVKVQDRVNIAFRVRAQRMARDTM